MTTTPTPTTRPHRDHTAVRLDPPTIARIETIRARMGLRAADMGAQITTSDALRAIIARGLPALEADYPGDGSPTPPTTTTTKQRPGRRGARR